ncbi:unnamed protein product (macronuclear) [Paramecium tetraurelia]|uniref:PH domain-containing protein n=2 Tax=Paramecium TaxID=5884 RepID=A0BXI5_PARTE|nr:uncharacterized protein GSPATT00033105001 [Paramecium tetraurelia]CAD8200545.1 unnamed protein product [Paramecium octaurelia]CAK63252.1 unnamed protein product [Paramecium tetraurelia]|eukprot:XP_001430650.1 hypothetical protein (macronuclear) [Paramecium tetraurelia strain d4-2]
MGCVTQKQKKDFKFSTIPIQEQRQDDLDEWTKIIQQQQGKHLNHSGKAIITKSKTLSARYHQPLEQIDEEEV